MGFIADDDYPGRGVPSPDRRRGVETRLPPTHDDMVRVCAVRGHHDDAPRIFGITFKVGPSSFFATVLSRLLADSLRDVGPPEVDPGDNKGGDCVDRYQPDGEQDGRLYGVNPDKLEDRGGPAGKA